MDKTTLSERDICTKFITPALLQAWRKQEQIREEVSFTKGKIKVRGKTLSRGEAKRADYILYYQNNFPLAIIEAKDNKQSIGAGMQQALNYAEILNVPFVFSSNGDGFLAHDRIKKEGEVEQTLKLEEFPSPKELYQRYLISKGITPEQEQIISYPSYDDGSGKQPRYYQEIAINKTIEAIARGQNRILLVMATGTGKTYTAFQIIWRLRKSRAKKRILFLADRNILVDQTMINDFKPFGDRMTKVSKRTVDKAYEIYLALYQGLTGTEDFDNIYREFSPDFFDLIVVDECHRGSAKDNSARRDILTYFSKATQIGLTATPKETEDISTSTYFGEPVYTYSLKQGIEDWFLAPYKVIKILLNIDDEWRPYKGQLDYFEKEIPDKEYNIKDYDKIVIIKERTEEVARRITEYLKATDRFSKTIVFCVDIDHAERMRQALVNENADEVAKNRKYIMRITGDNQEGKAELDNFIDPKEPYPVIVTTSKLLTTWVDAQTCKIIVLDTVINSMTEFKQIIGRGTRIREDFGKYYFTIMDFRKATNLFADPQFDGEPEVIYEPKPDEPVGSEEGEPTTSAGESEDWEIETPISPYTWRDEPTRARGKIFVEGVSVEIINERVQYLWTDGKLITESLKDFTKKNVLKNYASLDDFLVEWQSAEKKQAIIEALEEKGILFEELQQQTGNQTFDPFDMICHIAFDKPPLTRAERAKKVPKETLFTKYGEQAKEIIEMLLIKYADQGIQVIENINILKISPFSKIGTPYEIVNNIFWTKERYLEMLRELEKSLYEEVVS